MGAGELAMLIVCAWGSVQADFSRIRIGARSTRDMRFGTMLGSAAPQRTSLLPTDVTIHVSEILEI